MIAVVLEKGGEYEQSLILMNRMDRLLRSRANYKSAERKVWFMDPAVYRGQAKKFAGGDYTPIPSATQPMGLRCLDHDMAMEGIVLTLTTILE